MIIDEIVQEVLDAQKKLEEREEIFNKIYPESGHNRKYETKKYNRAKDYAKILFKKFLKRIDNRYFIIKERWSDRKTVFIIGKLINGKFEYLYDSDKMIWKESILSFGFPPEHTYLSWYKSTGPDAKTHRFKVYRRGWSTDLQDLFDKTNDDIILYTFDDEESALLFYEMMEGE